MWTCFHFLVVLGQIVGIFSLEDLRNISMLMPSVVPKYKESHLCISRKLEESHKIYITEFEPIFTDGVAHHMLILLCSKPGSTEEVYSCNRHMDQEEQERHEDPQVPMCDKSDPYARKSQLLYLWGRNAGKMVMPDEIAYEVGGRSGLNYLIFQIHYINVNSFKDGVTDSSGVIVHYTTVPQPKIAGIYQISIVGEIQPGADEYLEGTCTMSEDKELHVFAFRTHTHDHGRVVSGFKVVSDATTSNWTLIGKRNPQLPQVFHPLKNEILMHKGDDLAARCTYDNDLGSVVKTGLLSTTEMCKFYFVYWTLGEKLTDDHCEVTGAPVSYWKDNEKLKSFPSFNQASVLNSTGEEHAGSHTVSFMRDIGLYPRLIPLLILCFRSVI